MLIDGGSKMQYKEVAGGICAPKGFAAAGVHCGIRANHNEKYDLALIKAEVRCAAAGVYTTNKVCGAPIKVDRAHLKDGYAQAILVNSGNANTCAPNGVQLAKDTCDIVAKELGIRIFTIGIGTPEGAPIRIGGEFIRDEKGDMVVSKLDEQMLQQIADITGGAYVRSSNQSVGLDEIVQSINRMEATELSTDKFEEYNEQ